MVTFLLISTIVVWLAVLFLAFLLLGALRAVGLLHWRVDELLAITPRYAGRSGLLPGTKAPAITLPDANGSDFSLNRYAGRKVLWVFAQPGCGPCHAIVPELNRLQRRDDLQVIVAINGDAAAARQWAVDAGATFPVIVQERFELSKRFQVFATPFAFVINEAGVIAAKGLVSNRQYLAFVLSAAHGATSTGHAEGLTNPSESGESQESVSITSEEMSHV